MRGFATPIDVCRLCLLLPLMVAVFGSPAPLHAHATAEKHVDQSVTNEIEPQQPALRKELLARFNQDQDARLKMIEWQKGSGLLFGSPEFFQQAAPMIEEGKKIDEDNTAWFTKVLDEHGWPGRSMVGEDGAQAAFILAQHADRDRPLQKRCLKSMQRAPAGEVQPQNMAYLTDRVLLAEGKPQRYGTQVEFLKSGWQPRPVEDPDHLDERRQSVGLPPIDEYLKMIAEVYDKPAEKNAVE
jgi:hypothetical protein